MSLYLSIDNKASKLTPHTLRLFDDIACLVVGPEERVIKIHKGLLCSESAYFKAALGGRFKEAQEQRIQLLEEDPDVMDRFQRWIYTRNPYEKGEVVKDASWDLLVELCVFADNRLVTKLHNLMIDHIIEKEDLTHEIPAYKLTFVYQKTLPSSPIRRLLVDLSARLGLIDTWGIVSEDESRRREYPELFLRELVVALYKDKKSKEPRNFEVFSCDYHVHSEGEARCSS